MYIYKLIQIFISIFLSHAPAHASNTSQGRELDVAIQSSNMCDIQPGEMRVYVCDDATGRTMLKSFRSYTAHVFLRNIFVAP
jgi:hypothetical protein